MIVPIIERDAVLAFDILIVYQNMLHLYERAA